MEYLMTYGWAILIVIIVAAAMYSLGIFNPATWTGTRATGFANIGSPVDWIYYNNGSFSILLKNSLGSPITISSVKAVCNTSMTDNEVDLVTTSSTTIGAGSSIEFFSNASIVNCDALTTGSSYSTQVAVRYTKGSGVYPQTDTGTVTGSVV